MRKFFKYWLPVIIWALIIFKLSSGSLPTVGESYWDDFAFKKFSHIFFYAVFGVLNYRALLQYPKMRANTVFMAIFISFLYGISDEIHQSFIPGRGPHIRDVLFDTIGATLGVFIYNKLNEIK